MQQPNGAPPETAQANRDGLLLVIRDALACSWFKPQQLASWTTTTCFFVYRDSFLIWLHPARERGCRMAFQARSDQAYQDWFGIAQASRLKDPGRPPPAANRRLPPIRRTTATRGDNSFYLTKHCVGGKIL